MEALKNAQSLVSSVLGDQTCGTLTNLTLKNIYKITGDSRGTKAVRAACKEVGSVSDIIFEMRFNVNVFSPGTVRNDTHTQEYLPEHIELFLCFVFRSIFPS